MLPEPSAQQQQEQPQEQPQGQIPTNNQDLGVMILQLMQMIADTQATQTTILNNNGANLPRGIKLNAPDPYHGERTTAAVENWIYMLNNYFDLLTLDDTQQIAFAVNLLRDAALLWWKQLTSDKSEYTPRTWADFCKTIREEFKPGNAEALALQQIRKLVQKGSITDYVAQFRKTMVDLPGMLDRDAKFQFIQGLQYEAKMQVMLREPSTLLEAYKVAEYFEMVLYLPY